MNEQNPKERPIDPDFLERLSEIKVLVLDVDGTMTDGGIFIDSNGAEFKRFDAHDGYGIKVLPAKTGIEVIIISGRTSTPVELRAKELGIHVVLQGHFVKTEALENFIAERGLKREEVATMGDELSDLDMAVQAGVSFAPANAVDEVKLRVDYVTERSGGFGAVREVCDLLIRAKSASKLS